MARIFNALTAVTQDGISQSFSVGGFLNSVARTATLQVTAALNPGFEFLDPLNFGVIAEGSLDGVNWFRLGEHGSFVSRTVTVGAQELDWFWNPTVGTGMSTNDHYMFMRPQFRYIRVRVAGLPANGSVSITAHICVSDIEQIN